MSQNIKVFLKIVVFCYEHTVFASVFGLQTKADILQNGCSEKNCKNSQESTCSGVSFSIKLQSSG